MPADRVTVVYADDHSRYRTALLRDLVDDPRLDLRAIAIDSEAVVRAVERHHPDVVLVDAAIAAAAVGAGGVTGTAALASADHLALLSLDPVDGDAIGAELVIRKATSSHRICDALVALGGRALV